MVTTPMPDTTQHELRCSRSTVGTGEQLAQDITGATITL